VDTAERQSEMLKNVQAVLVSMLRLIALSDGLLPCFIRVVMLAVMMTMVLKKKKKKMFS
jgi:hypothetical protein